MVKTAEVVYEFWFRSGLGDKRRFSSPDFDKEIWDKFGATWLAAVQGLLSGWRKTARGRLSEIVVIDQFSRHLNRGSAKSYLYDPMAMVLAQELIALDEFSSFSPEEKHYTYLALMHIESAALHEKLIRYYEEEEMADYLLFEQKHKALIDAFGRYPHRNEVLNRESTTAELVYLNQSGGKMFIEPSED